MFRKIILAALYLILIPAVHLSASDRYPLEPADTVSPRTGTDMTRNMTPTEV